MGWKGAAYRVYGPVVDPNYRLVRAPINSQPERGCVGCTIGCVFAFFILLSVVCCIGLAT